MYFLPLLLLWLSGLAQAQDLRNGEDINEICATCHGAHGQGGKQGEYPRLAGLPPTYLGQQLLLFRTRQRPNMPMVEHTAENQLSDADIADVSNYLNKIELPTKLPPIDAGHYDPYERLLLAERTFNVARAPGDSDRGQRLYHKECRSCHGEAGWGKPDKQVPFLAGQYTEYLQRQVELFITKQRIHDPDAPEDELLAAFAPDELQDIFAYLSIVDD